MASIVTLQEREARTAAARMDADRIVIALQVYAQQNGGRFIAYGSAARREMRHDSDIDILIEFPVETISAARNFAEDLCFTAHLPADIFPITTHSAAFLDRVMPDALILS
ncbi:Nucleotidyltransferase domain-containing protein [Loktanella atrilutea]|uniref:Nucleotidyltransferase domain-containing protein n=1 Tax=Loktanella atrilutea TaxID=366533 RepID=A0A1M5FHU3_LOKAT|nr:Nucleotidyltransferase domain-containing protein [Loktanella atrilutea]